MARRRFFVHSVHAGRAELAGEDARHLRQVLRAEVGQQYEISDNRSVFLAEIEAFGRERVSFRILEKLSVEEMPVRLHLLLTLVKFDRFELAIEKATELGAEQITPVRAERSEKGLERAAVKRLERWRKIARESSQQARRARIPEIANPVDIGAALATAGSLRFFLDERREAPTLFSAIPATRQPADVVCVLVGPEGGWTHAERDAAQRAGWTPVSLGPTILRAETAAIAALAVLIAAWNVDRGT